MWHGLLGILNVYGQAASDVVFIVCFPLQLGRDEAAELPVVVVCCTCCCVESAPFPCAGGGVGVRLACDGCPELRHLARLPPSVRW